MSILSRVLYFFPFFLFSVFFTLTTISFYFQNWLFMACAFGFIYFFPILCLRLNTLTFGPGRELQKFVGHRYNVWWGNHQIQLFFIAFPFFETLLRIIPGAYSGWLRLWGAKIGKNVYWTPHIEILDRNQIEVGDNVVFGHLVKISSHIVTPRKNSYWIFVKTVKIHSGSFLGAGTVLGPGTEIKENEFVPAGREYFNNELFQR